MTVLSPSLPPESWMTTRIVSPRDSAARADAERRNCGTNGARETSPAEPIVDLRKLRLLVPMVMGHLLGELKLGGGRESVNRVRDGDTCRGRRSAFHDPDKSHPRLVGQGLCQEQLRQPIDEPQRRCGSQLACE